MGMTVMKSEMINMITDGLKPILSKKIKMSEKRLHKLANELAREAFKIDSSCSICIPPDDDD